MIEPVGDRVIVKPAEAAESIGGVIIPDMAKETPREGEVMAKGDGDEAKAASYQVGDKVLFSQYGGIDMEAEGVAYLILRTTDILARVT